MRRPHAYDFLRGYPELTEPMRRPGSDVIDGTRAPIPGVCLLEADGRLIDWLDLSGPSTRARLLELLGDD